MHLRKQVYSQKKGGLKYNHAGIMSRKKLQCLYCLGRFAQVLLTTSWHEPFKCQPRKMVKHIQTIRWQFFLNVFDYFVGLTLKGLRNFL